MPESAEMTEEDQISFSSPPELEDVDTGLEGNVEQDYKKARDKNLSISEVNRKSSVWRNAVSKE